VRALAGEADTERLAGTVDRVIGGGAGMRNWGNLVEGILLGAWE